jgi:hypothetical protein
MRAGYLILALIFFLTRVAGQGLLNLSEQKIKTVMNKQGMILDTKPLKEPPFIKKSTILIPAVRSLFFYEPTKASKSNIESYCFFMTKAGICNAYFIRFKNLSLLKKMTADFDKGDTTIRVSKDFRWLNLDKHYTAEIDEVDDNKIIKGFTLKYSNTKRK